MYLSNIKLWNFRKYGSENFDSAKPNIELNFNKNLNVLIGENDSGKTAIIDAIKLVLKTHTYDWIKVEDEDFFQNQDKFRIELLFENLKDEEAKNFTEWLGWNGEGACAKPFLKLIYDVKRNKERIFPSEVKAGADDVGYPLTAGAADYLKVTYLKPLRDAENELIAKKNSRLSKILQEHEAFSDKENHYLMGLFKKFNESIEKYFEGKNANGEDLPDEKGKELKGKIDEFIQNFYDKDKESNYKTTDADLKNILEKIELSIKDVKNPGLGTMNRLFMATELLHLDKNNYDGLKLGLIEELEAHLHPQAQMKVIEALQKQTDIQLILTTHSPNLASKVKLEHLIICEEVNTFPMGKVYTELEPDNYKFLERFLDVTKANLFFAKGVILVEGWAEEILIPALAKRIGIDLTQHEVSVVNIGNTGFRHYSKIFLRKGTPFMDIPVAIVTDVDVRIYEKNSNGSILKKDDNTIRTETNQKIENFKRTYKKQKNDIFIAPIWTLEWCLYKSESLGSRFINIVKCVHSNTDWENFESKLAEKLIKKSLEKTEIAYKLAQVLDDDDSININIFNDGDPINYLVKAIKYASRQS